MLKEAPHICFSTLLTKVESQSLWGHMHLHQGALFFWLLGRTMRLVIGNCTWDLRYPCLGYLLLRCLWRCMFAWNPGAGCLSQATTPTAGHRNGEIQHLDLLPGWGSMTGAGTKHAIMHSLAVFSIIVSKLHLILMILSSTFHDASFFHTTSLRKFFHYYTIWCFFFLLCMLLIKQL